MTTYRGSGSVVTGARVYDANSTTVSTLAEAKAFSAGTVDYLYLRGRTSIGDGYEGFFYWDSSDLSTEVAADTQNEIYIPPDSDNTGASGAWVRVYDGEVNVKWFGAIGDGVTDDTAAIQAAIDSGSKNVFMPSGTYKITSALDLPDGLFLSGEHPFTTTIDCVGITGSSVKINGTTSPDNSFEHVHLSGFTLDGNATTYNAGDDGVDVYKTTRTKLSWLIVKNFGDKGLSFRGRNFHAEIDTVDSSGNFGWNAHVDIGGTRNNAFLWKNFRMYPTAAGSSGGGIYLNQCNTHKFLNCNFEDTGSTGYQAYIADNVHNIEFDTCYFENNTRTGNHILINGSSSACTGINFNNCNISSSADTAKVTLLKLQNVNEVDIIGGRFELFQSSGTYAHEAIATSSAASRISEKTSFNLDHANSVERNINSATIGTYFIDGERYNRLLVRTEKTSSDTLTEADIGGVFTNNGAGGIVELQLPATGSATRGAVFTFVRNNGGNALQIQPQSGGNIRGGGTDKYMSLDTQGAAVALINTTGKVWDILSTHGTTSFEP